MCLVKFIISKNRIIKNSLVKFIDETIDKTWNLCNSSCFGWNVVFWSIILFNLLLILFLFTFWHWISIYGAFFTINLIFHLASDFISYVGFKVKVKITKPQSGWSSFSLVIFHFFHFPFNQIKSHWNRWI